MVESVLTLLVFLALFIGIFDIGEMFFVHQTLTDRARNAVRWGAVHTFDANSIQNLVLYGALTPADGQSPSFGLTAANVTVTRPAASIGQRNICMPCIHRHDESRPRPCAAGTPDTRLNG